MAGGIDWFRWHHGTVNDPKLRVVAKRAGARVTEALAVWQTLLEQASSNDDRGHPGNVDYEAIDLSLDMREGTAQALHDAFKAKGLIDSETGRIAKWEARQPKREDDTAADRKRAQREREAAAKLAAERDGSDSHAESRNVTTEEKRGEEKRGDSHSDEGEEDTQRPTPAGEVCLALKGAGIWPVNPSHPTLAILLAAGATTAEFVDAAPKAKNKRGAFEYVLGVVKGQREDAARDAKRLHTGPMPARSPPMSFREREAATKAARIREVVGTGFDQFDSNTIDMEGSNATLPAID